MAELAKQDSLINELLQVQFELASLSDRVGVCCLSLLSKEDKLKAFTSTWALNFGTRFLTEKAKDDSNAGSFDEKISGSGH